MRFELRESSAWLREQLDRARFWRWEIARFPLKDGSPYDVLYAGRIAHRVELSKVLPGINDVSDTGKVSANKSSHTVLVSQIPIPGALCVPQILRAIVPLGRTIEEIASGYDSELRRSLRKHRPRYRMQQVLSIAEIDRTYDEMLLPYVTARHGSHAILKSPSEVRRCALEYGRLDLVLSGDEVVACLLGSEYVRAGKRYWLLESYGYPETVFSDPGRLRETNSVNNHMALEWAIENGFAYYDIGLCFARPDDGLLQWKRRRGGVLDRTGLRGRGYFHIRLPKTGAAQFLWDIPLFAVERRKLTLHLGLPDGPSDDEFATRYRQMGFGGLSKVYLHSAKPPSEQILNTLRDLYKHQNTPPAVESISST